MRTLLARTILMSVLLIFTASEAAIAQTLSASAEEANKLFQAQKWAESAKAYEAITKAEPTNGTAWGRLATSLQSMGKYQEAVAAWLRAIEISQRPLAMYKLGSTYARLDEKDKAFEWLNKAITAGFPRLDLLKTDNDLGSLRDDARFAQLVALGEKISKPCMYSDEARRFDFWVGEWEVQIGGQKVGDNVIERIADGCIIMENWTAGGQTGKSINFYNPVTRKWRQTYVDSRATVYEMEGEYKEGAIRYEGVLFASGGKVLTRWAFFNLGADRVRQLGENSSDDGKTWTVIWDAMYIRKK